MLSIIGRGGKRCDAPEFVWTKWLYIRQTLDANLTERRTNTIDLSAYFGYNTILIILYWIKYKTGHEETLKSNIFQVADKSDSHATDVVRFMDMDIRRELITHAAYFGFDNKGDLFEALHVALQSARFYHGQYCPLAIMLNNFLAYADKCKETAYNVCLCAEEAKDGARTSIRTHPHRRIKKDDAKTKRDKAMCARCKLWIGIQNPTASGQWFGRNQNDIHCTISTHELHRPFQTSPYFNKVCFPNYSILNLEMGNELCTVLLSQLCEVDPLNMKQPIKADKDKVKITFEELLIARGDMDIYISLKQKPNGEYAPVEPLLLYRHPTVFHAAAAIGDSYMVLDWHAKDLAQTATPTNTPIDPSCRQYLCNKPDDKGDLPLHVAARANKFDTFLTLLNITTSTTGVSGKYLIQTRGEFGDTLAHCAAKSLATYDPFGLGHIICHLITRDWVDWSMQNDLGATVMDILIEQNTLRAVQDVLTRQIERTLPNGEGMLVDFDDDQDAHAVSIYDSYIEEEEDDGLYQHEATDDGDGEQLNLTDDEQ